MPSEKLGIFCLFLFTFTIIRVKIKEKDKKGSIQWKIYLKSKNFSII